MEGMDQKDVYKCKQKQLFSRYIPIEMVRVKPFGKKLLGKNRSLFKQSLETCNLSENVDGESVVYAARELLAQKGHRKLMIVLSDGKPACGGSKTKQLNWHLSESVKDIQKSGVEVVIKRTKMNVGTIIITIDFYEKILFI